LNDKRIALAPLPPVVGKVALDRILEVKPGYRVDASAYKPDPAKVAALKSVSTPTEIRVFFGTWCLSCKRLLPGMIKSLEAAANPKIEVAYYGVSEDLAEPAKELAASSVSKTPTILVLQNGREVGRIEEKAETTIEGDLAAILGPKR
jgi:thiol-disulfide isomerase/thioredoxin